MDVSKLTIDPEKLKFTKMPAVKRTQLRERNIIDLIRSKPAGTYISGAEFAAVTGKTSSNVLTMIHSMEKEEL